MVDYLMLQRRLRFSVVRKKFADANVPSWEARLQPFQPIVFELGQSPACFREAKLKFDWQDTFEIKGQDWIEGFRILVPV